MKEDHAFDLRRKVGQSGEPPYGGCIDRREAIVGEE
jgi:hypothetical protein